jgi:hypothetical protein
MIPALTGTLRPTPASPPPATAAQTVGAAIDFALPARRVREVLLECDASSHCFGPEKLSPKGPPVIWRCYAGELAARAATLLYASRHLHHYGGNAASKASFDSPAKLDLLRDTTFELAGNYALTLQHGLSCPIIIIS